MSKSAENNWSPFAMARRLVSAAHSLARLRRIYQALQRVSQQRHRSPPAGPTRPSRQLPQPPSHRSRCAGPGLWTSTVVTTTSCCSARPRSDTDLVNAGKWLATSEWVSRTCGRPSAPVIQRDLRWWSRTVSGRASSCCNRSWTKSIPTSESFGLMSLASADPRCRPDHIGSPASFDCWIGYSTSSAATGSTCWASRGAGGWLSSSRCTSHDDAVVSFWPTRRPGR